jgi:putative transcriptional regulator
MPKEKIDAAVMDPEMQAFAQDVLTSIQQARRGEGRVHQVTLSAAAEARAKVGLTQSAFAQLMGVSVRTLQNWEQGRSQPSGAAQTLIKVAQQWPDVLRSMA